MEVLNQICREHGIEPLAPEKSRGTLEVAEYKEQRQKADELAEQNIQADAELSEKKAAIKAAENKTAKLTEIDSIETGKTVFGGKVTVSQEDWENVTALAKKEVTSLKQTKKLRKERDEAVQKCDTLRKQLDAVSAELAEYKKKEDEKRHFSREKLYEQTQQISDREKLRKAMTFIDACGLRSDYEKFRYNGNMRKNVLE